MNREISLFTDIVCLLRFVWLFIKERPYMVHGNTPKASLLSMVAAWLTRRPVRIYMCHGLRYQTTTGTLRKVLMTMERLSCSCATRVICVSEGVQKQLVADGICNEEKVMVMGYGTAGGIDVEFFSLNAISGTVPVRKQLGISEAAFVFCFVGRIVKDKGINELVTAFDRLSQKNDNIYLLLIGPMENDLDPISLDTAQLIDRNAHIHAAGLQKDVRPWLAASDAFVLPSYREGVGMVLLEGNAMGVPCIASDIIGCNDVVTAGVNGELVQPRDVESLYVKMEEWICNPEKVRVMAEQCRDYVVKRYKAENVRDAYYQEYCKIAKIKVL